MLRANLRSRDSFLPNHFFAISKVVYLMLSQRRKKALRKSREGPSESGKNLFLRISGFAPKEFSFSVLFHCLPSCSCAFTMNDEKCKSITGEKSIKSQEDLKNEMEGFLSLFSFWEKFFTLNSL